MLDALFNLSLSRPQFLNPRFDPGPFRAEALLFCLQFFSRCFQFLLQPRLRLFVCRQFSLQLAALLGSVRCLLISAAAACGFFSQCVRQPLDFLLNRDLGRLQFLKALFQPDHLAC